ncbi:hypothetical protein PR048_005744 [Dryococelus australis]|uniref:Uncharacterized protein n=1 Tax=Dryococelus australis TaxID=614101 RepID=A0ABQ9I968_9NEOP|nr:hypothetical protein PR048_005744 [Dryococelus australis]
MFLVGFGLRIFLPACRLRTVLAMLGLKINCQCEDLEYFWPCADLEVLSAGVWGHENHFGWFSDFHICWAVFGVVSERGDINIYFSGVLVGAIASGGLHVNVRVVQFEQYLNLWCTVGGTTLRLKLVNMRKLGDVGRWMTSTDSDRRAAVHWAGTSARVAVVLASGKYSIISSKIEGSIASQRRTKHKQSFTGRGYGEGLKGEGTPQRTDSVGVIEMSMEQRRNERSRKLKIPRKPADQRHRPARFPHAKIRSDPAGIEPESPCLLVNKLARRRKSYDEGYKRVCRRSLQIEDGVKGGRLINERWGVICAMANLPPPPLAPHQLTNALYLKPPPAIQPTPRFGASAVRKLVLAALRRVHQMAGITATKKKCYDDFNVPAAEEKFVSHDQKQHFPTVTSDKYVRNYHRRLAAVKFVRNFQSLKLPSGKFMATRYREVNCCTVCEEVTGHDQERMSLLNMMSRKGLLCDQLKRPSSVAAYLPCTVTDDIPDIDPIASTHLTSRDTYRIACYESRSGLCATSTRSSQRRHRQADWLDYLPPTYGKSVRFPTVLSPGFSHVGIVPDNAAGQRLLTSRLMCGEYGAASECNGTGKREIPEKICRLAGITRVVINTDLAMWRSRGGLVVRILTSHIGEPGSIPGRVTPEVLMGNISRYGQSAHLVCFHIVLTPSHSYSPLWCIRAALLNFTVWPLFRNARGVETWKCSQDPGRVERHVDMLPPDSVMWECRVENEPDSFLLRFLTFFLINVSEPMKVIEGNMDQRRNERAGGTGGSREIPPASGIVQQYSHMRKSGKAEAALGVPGEATGGGEGGAAALEGSRRAPRLQVGRLQLQVPQEAAVIVPRWLHRCLYKQTQHVTSCAQGKLEIPEKTRLQEPSSSTITKCVKPGVAPSGIEPGSPCWLASALAPRACRTTSTGKHWSSDPLSLLDDLNCHALQVSARELRIHSIGVTTEAAAKSDISSGAGRRLLLNWEPDVDAKWRNSGERGQSAGASCPTAIEVRMRRLRGSRREVASLSLPLPLPPAKNRLKKTRFGSCSSSRQAARGSGNGLIGYCVLRKVSYWLNCQLARRLLGADWRTALQHFAGAYCCSTSGYVNSVYTPFTVTFHFPEVLPKFYFQ